MDTYTDEELMSLVQKQDTSAFEELFRRYEQRVFAFYWRLSADRQQAEDGTQEAFLRLWKARVRYEPTGRFSTYLFQIAKNHFLHEQQKQDRRTDCQQAPASEAPSSGSDRQLVAGELQTAVQEAVARLPEPQRLVYVLSEQEGMSYKQVAEVLDCPVGTVSSRKVQAVRRLRELLRPLRNDLLGGGKG
ncbi:MAG: sigma-70 family RNA polymerase sigma factor [Sedimentisphaerales bacterium]|nr:sigma-70 family RNA polymerase sigma factor [Sedimentisphaerales bacterium]